MFPSKRFLGFMCPALPGALLDVSLIHFVVNFSSQLTHIWAWLTNAPMPQPLRVLGCEVKAKYVIVI